jgi:uncharacterized protein YqhQ
MTERDQTQAAPEAPKLGAVGGEALMEGIMMRGPKGAAVALRLPDGSVETTEKNVKSPADKHKWLGWPLIRGPVNFVWSMLFGYKCMMESAEKATAAAMESNGAAAESKIDRWLEAHMGPKLMAAVTGVGTVLGVGVALGLFVWAPTALTRWLVPERLSRYYALIGGLIRVVLFVGYMFAMSLLKDIRRVFQYHGAEHKAIFCYEAGLPLTVENVRAQSRLHPRCGTSFLFLMILLSIVLTSAVNAVWPGLATVNWAQIAIKILQFPLIMALGYEFIRYAGKHLKNPLVRFVSAPGLAMQRITTKEPDDAIIEVGIAALQAALGEEPMQEAGIRVQEAGDDDDTAGGGACEGDPPME